MQTFINIFFMIASWCAGIFVFSIAMEKFRNYRENKVAGDLFYGLALLVIVVLSIVIAGLLNNIQGALFMVSGYVVSAISVIDPIKLTQPKADEIAAKAAEKQAAKEAEEERKKEESRKKRENAKIYAEEKKKQKKAAKN